MYSHYDALRYYYESQQDLEQMNLPNQVTDPTVKDMDNVAEYEKENNIDNVKPSLMGKFKALPMYKKVLVFAVIAILIYKFK